MAERIAPTAVMCFSGGNGGMERSAVRLADTLAQITETTLLCKRDSFIEDLYSRGDHAFACDSIGFRSRTFSPAMLVRVRSAIRARRLQNVIFFGASELKTLYFAFLGFDIRLTVWHGTTKSRPKHDLFHRLVYSRVDYHVALSKHLLNNVMRIVPPSARAQFRVVYPSFSIAIDRDSARATAAGGRLKLVHIGRVAAGKGQVDAVKACASLHSAGVDFQLDLVGPTGDEKYRRELVEVIRLAPYADRVFTRGYVENTAEYLQQADVLLFPSHGEGMPNAFIEALHYGVPCLAYSNTVFPEYGEMGFRVHLVQHRNTDLLAAELLAIAQNLPAEKTAAANNRELALGYFNVARELESWRAILA